MNNIYPNSSENAIVMDNNCIIPKDLSVERNLYVGNSCNIGSSLCVPMIHSEYSLNRLHLMDMIFTDSTSSFGIINSDLSGHSYKINIRSENNTNYTITLPDALTIASGVNYTFYVTDNAGQINANSNTLTFNFQSGKVFGNIVGNGVTISVNAYVTNGNVQDYVFNTSVSHLESTSVTATLTPNSNFTQNINYSGQNSIVLNVKNLCIGDKIQLSYMGIGNGPNNIWIVDGLLTNYSAYVSS